MEKLQENLKSQFGGKADGHTELRPPDPPPGGREGGDVSQPARSYAAAAVGKASQFPAINLPRRQPFNKEGKPAIIFTPAEIGACAKQLEFALIVKFSNGRPHVSVVEKEFRNSWKLEGQLTVSDLDGRHILIILNSERDAIAALTQAPRRVGTSLFRLFKWTPEFHLRKESTIITIWIRFPRLRPDLFNEGVLKCLCQPFGRFLDSDGHTKQRTRCAFARCCVEIDISKTLPHEIWIDTGDGNGWWQEIVYEGNLKYCSKCKIHGHNLSECRKMRMKPPERKDEISDPIQKVQGEKGDVAGQVPTKKQNNNQEWIQVHNKKFSSANKAPNNQQQAVPVEGETGQNLFPSLVEEGEIEEILESETGSEGDQELNKILLKKATQKLI